ncbi:phosphopantetheine-binding protein [Streptomyces luteogriseus]|uniref:phosphopantetheine-binding protein n=1 Tax=Streptomyces luteogriseus TaxID=68233 RepID=UPI0037A5F12A
MKRTEIIEQIRLALGSALEREPADLSESTTLFEELAVDSTGVLELLLALEDALVLEIDPEALEPEVFETVGTLADYVESMVSRKAAV